MMQLIRKRHFITQLSLSILLLFIMFLFSLRFGAAETNLKGVMLAIFSDQTSNQLSIIRDIRMPREVGAIFVGAALAVSGAIMQGMTRNPLAEPGILGLTAGASTMLAIVHAFLPGVNYYGMIIACFLGALMGTLMVFGISATKKGASFSHFRIVLAGAAVSAFLVAVEQGVGIYFKVSKNISMWTAGGLIGTTWPQLKIIIPFLLFGILIAIFFSRQLTVLSLNEEIAVGLGQRIFFVKVMLFVAVVILAGTAVALVGNIAFVGLMIPHIVRGFAGQDYRLVIPLVAVTGASFMLFADTMARVINAPYETPLIAIVAIIGLPFFLIIIRKGGNMA